MLASWGEQLRSILDEKQVMVNGCYCFKKNFFLKLTGWPQKNCEVPWFNQKLCVDPKLRSLQIHLESHGGKSTHLAYAPWPSDFGDSGREIHHASLCIVCTAKKNHSQSSWAKCGLENDPFVGLASFKPTSRSRSKRQFLFHMLSGPHAAKFGKSTPTKITVLPLSNVIQTSYAIQTCRIMCHLRLLRAAKRGEKTAILVASIGWSEAMPNPKSQCWNHREDALGHFSPSPNLGPKPKLGTRWT